MSISISSTEVKITDNIYNLQDIYDYADDHNKTQYVKKLGNHYEITVDVRIESGAIEDSNITLTVLGELFQIHKNAHLKLGKVREDLSTYDGCYFNMPNVKNGYGFGHTTKSNSGNLYLYGSNIDIWGFWGFFNDDNTKVEVIDCQVNGFGRIEGTSSILKNINFKQSHGMYGILSPKGQLDINENLSVLECLPHNGNNCGVYHNPQYANNLIITGGIYDGYDDLAYIESTSGGDQLRFIDSEIRNGYSMNRESNNVDFFHDFTFNPTIRDNSGNFLSGVRCIINDVNNNEVFNNLSSPTGEISTTLNYYFQDRDGNETYNTPHTIIISKDDIVSTYEITMNKPLTNFPLYLVEAGSSSGEGDSCDCSNIQTINDNFEARINTKLNLMESGIRQLIGNVVDEVNENETYFKESGFTIMM